MNDRAAEATTLPLAGVVIVALEQAVAMPFCTFILAEMGARVVKIEKPGGGDTIRSWDDVVDGLSSGFVWLNSNKESLAVDVGRPEGRTIVRALAASADIFVENLAPDAAQRLGLGYEALVPDNPGLVYCSLSGYGQSGPYQKMKAYDLLVQGEAGLLMVNGTPDSPAKVGLPITDLIAGSNAAIAILGALHARRPGVAGGYLDIAMLDGVYSWLGYYPHRAWHGLGDPPRTGIRHQYMCPYGPYLANDGVYVNVAVASDKHWHSFCTEIMMRPEWLTDDRFATVVARSEHREVLDPMVAQAMASEDSETIFARLRKSQIPFGRVRQISEALEHPQLAARGLVVTANTRAGSARLLRMPVVGPDSRSRALPELGANTEPLLRELGYSRAQISELVASGVCRLNDSESLRVRTDNK